jgi:hypothetical protein
LPSTICSCLASDPKAALHLHQSPAWPPLTCGWGCLSPEFISLLPTLFQPYLLLGLPCLLPSTETRAPRPWQMCGAGGGTPSPDVIMFMFPESEGRELWTEAVWGRGVQAAAPCPSLPSPTFLLRPVYLALPCRGPISKSHSIRLGHTLRRTFLSEGEKALAQCDLCSDS